MSEKQTCFICGQEKENAKPIHESLPPVCGTCLKQGTIYFLKFLELQTKLTTGQATMFNSKSNNIPNQL